MADNAKPNLMTKLVKDAVTQGKSKTKKNKAGKAEKVDFATAMEQMGNVSVFDIVRQAKHTFVSELALLSDADGALAYENAQCYATQIARSYRDYQVSSGRTQIATAATGIRSLVDIGPSYPNLFKENWDQFCKVGAIAAVDSPVAYLHSLYSFIKREIIKETAAREGSVDIPLDSRRPDIKDLMLDQQSAFTPVPMLSIVSNVLTKGIRDYVDAVVDPPHPGKGQTIYSLLAEKRHPFVFPYSYHHHQIMLGLSGKKQPVLGEINYRVSLKVPTITGTNVYGSVNGAVTVSTAQQMLSGLSAEQQALVSAPNPFATFYVCKNDLELPEAKWWRSSTTHRYCLWKHERLAQFAHVIPPQSTVKSVEPPAEVLTTGDNGPEQHNVLELALDESDKLLTLHIRNNCRIADESYIFVVNVKNATSVVSTFQLKSGATAAISEIGRTRFELNVLKEAAVDGVDPSRLLIIKQSVGIYLDPDVPAEYRLTDVEQSRLSTTYGVTAASTNTHALNNLNAFIKQTGLMADEVEELLAINQYFPKVSSNLKQPASNVAYYPTPLPNSMDYGASYVNGVGGWEPGTLRLTNSSNATADSKLFADCSMGLMAVGADAQSKSWYITNATLNRFERMQRMIRLQRWLDIPFAELDTLIMAAIHSEREHNLEWEINTNTLRALGTYRYLSKRYTLMPEEFAAFIHFITPFSCGERLPLFDRVFNSPALFDVPLTIDSGAFAIPPVNANDIRTVSQLAAGLGLSPSDPALALVATDITTLIAIKVDGTPHTASLNRSLTELSSFYRQGRIAQMFELTLHDSRALIDLLGGVAARTQVVRGSLRPLDAEGNVPDILDILMQMDWVVTWLKETGRTVADLLGVLTEEALVVTQELLDQLNALATQLSTVLLEQGQIEALNLPLDSTGADIGGWTMVSLLIDGGLVKVVPLTNIADAPGYFSAKVNEQLAAVVFHTDAARNAEIKSIASDKLSGFVAKGYINQHRLVEGLLQSYTGLPMDRAEGVLRWSYSGAAPLLKLLMVATQQGILALPLTGEGNALMAALSTIVRYARASLALNLSVEALRTFVQHPLLLGEGCNNGDNLTLSFASLYQLDRYSRWVAEAHASQEALLSYFNQANSSAPTRKSKASIADWTSDCAAALANLTGWPVTEVTTATTLLPDKIAKSMAQIDWVRRVQATCEASGMAAAEVLNAAKLTPESSAEQWQVVGQAAMAAHR